MSSAVTPCALAVPNRKSPPWMTYVVGCPGGTVVVSPGWVVGGAVTGGRVANAVVSGTSVDRSLPSAGGEAHDANALRASAPKTIGRIGRGTVPAYAGLRVDVGHA